MFAPQLKGRVAERLGRGLQNLVQRFKSARDLKKSLQETAGIFYFKLLFKAKWYFGLPNRENFNPNEDFL